MKTFKSVTSIFLLTLMTSVFAQPNTEVYLFDLKNDDGKLSISSPKNISDNPGYDNQPSFWPDGKSILYARTIDSQTDIARYFLDTQKTDIISNTRQGSEYSPTPMPDGRISSIRLDTTGLQLLYAYEFDGNNTVLVKDLKIGYHAWISKTDIVSFVLGDPQTMQIVNTKSGESRTVADRIGRSLHKVPGKKYFSYVDKSSDSWSIKSMNKKDESDMLVVTPEGSEDYCWTPSGQIIMGGGNTLYSWTDGGDWVEFANLEDFGLNGISRLTVSPDGNKLVVVVNQ